MLSHDFHALTGVAPLKQPICSGRGLHGSHFHALTGVAPLKLDDHSATDGLD
jgi:hypothetical protein